MDLDTYQYIVIEGPIDVGKTTLARKLGAHLGAQTVLEQAQDNPFLEKFYYDAVRYALQTQMFFVSTHPATTGAGTVRSVQHTFRR